MNNRPNPTNALAMLLAFAAYLVALHLGAEPLVALPMLLGALHPAGRGPKPPADGPPALTA